MEHKFETAAFNTGRYGKIDLKFISAEVPREPKNRNLMIGSEGISVMIGIMKELKSLHFHFSRPGSETSGMSASKIGLKPANPEVMIEKYFPPEFSELWKSSIEFLEELINNPEFIEFIGKVKEDIDGETLRNEIVELREGSYVPQSMNSIFSVNRVINLQHEPGHMTRGYMLRILNSNLSIETTSEIGDPNPEIFLSTFPEKSHLELMLNPVSRKCLVSRSGMQAYEPFTIEDAQLVIDSIIKRLGFFKNQAAAWREEGILTENDELQLLVGKAIEGIREYEIVIEPPKEPKLLY